MDRIGTLFSLHIKIHCFLWELVPSIATNCYYRVARKIRPQTHDHNSVKSEPIYIFFFTGRFVGKFAVKRILEIPLHLACVATLPLKPQSQQNKL